MTDLVTTKEAAIIAEVRPGTVRMWAHKGRIKRTNRVGPPLYDAAEVMEVERATRVNATRRGGRKRSPARL